MTREAVDSIDPPDDQEQATGTFTYPSKQSGVVEATHGVATKSPMIKPSHRGLLHKELGVAVGKKIGPAKLAAAKKTAGPVEMKRIVFAQNFGKKSKGAPGLEYAHPAMHSSKHN